MMSTHRQQGFEKLGCIRKQVGEHMKKSVLIDADQGWSKVVKKTQGSPAQSGHCILSQYPKFACIA